MRRTGNRPEGLERRRITVSCCSACGCPHDSMVFVAAEIQRRDDDGTVYPWKAWCAVARTWVWGTEESVPPAAPSG